MAFLSSLTASTQSTTLLCASTSLSYLSNRHCGSFCVPLASCLPQAAADYAKAHLPESLRQQLQALEREKRESAVSYARILEQRILTVDREMLDKLSANHDEAGREGEAGGQREGDKLT